MVKWMLMQLVLALVAAYSGSSFATMMCRPDEHDALLSFKAAFSIDNTSYSLACFGSYAKTESWEKNGDCCKWDGVRCDLQTGHVVELDLACSQLRGSFPSNTTLIRLRHLHRLSLQCNFLSGQVPREIGWLSHLTTLDLSFNDQLKMPDFQTIISNLTDLRYLDLSEVSLDSNLPPSIFNFTNLGYLGLFGCGLRGELPTANVNKSMLARVTDIDLSLNMLTGIIPGWLFTRPSIYSLSLYKNQFTWISEFEMGNVSSLTWFDANSNRLQGKILDGIFELYNLVYLNLQNNNLTGTILLIKIHKFQHMNSLYLSDNKLSIIDDIDFGDSKPSFPSFEVLLLSFCNLGRFPDFLREQRNLTWMELSDNGIHGILPDWFPTLGKLQTLNLSHNSLDGGLEHISRKSITEIDIQYNLFHGDVHIPSPTTRYFWASNNQFTVIPPSLCNVGELVLLDLAHNNLTGSIPSCFASLITRNLEILDLRQNQLQGAVPSLFQQCPNLTSLSLSGNKLEGQIPQSISSCSQLELLDLSSNNLNDKFPYWLGILPSLKVLILASNKLRGSLTSSYTASSFRMLQILDISNNDFTGNLPVDLLMSMNAMAQVDNTLFLAYIGSTYNYQDSIIAWVKGATCRIEAIYKALVLIDASRNKLDGPIPNIIRDLIALQSLNLAHNNFTGHIPPSLSNLSKLESLDLSFNRLHGDIPTELVNLNSLAFFNVSENSLVGAQQANNLIHLRTLPILGTWVCAALC